MKDRTILITNRRLGKLSCRFCATVWDHADEYHPQMVNQFHDLPYEAAREICETLTGLVPEYRGCVDHDHNDGYSFDYRGIWYHGSLIREGEFSQVTIIKCADLEVVRP